MISEDELSVISGMWVNQAVGLYIKPSYSRLTGDAKVKVCANIPKNI
tara:strand:+ start:131 stop:271 length:141 start_codon:yes stop_codon:yes gene_type:complete